MMCVRLSVSMPVDVGDKTDRLIESRMAVPTEPKLNGASVVSRRGLRERYVVSKRSVRPWCTPS